MLEQITSLPSVARIVGGSVFDGAVFTPGEVHVADGRVVEVHETGEGVTLDASGCYVIPGLLDVHFHGCMGDDLSDASPEGLHRMAAYEASRGVCAICPASMTLPHERLMPIMANAGAFTSEADESELVGVNMEGPYISPEKVGAQNPAYVRRASVEEFRELQEAAQGRIRLVDVAPEEPGNLDFVRAVSGKVRVSVAHTCAGYDDAKAAFAAGARHMTHLFNAMPSLHHRNPGPIAAGAETPGVTPELITDGVHVHPAMVRLAFELFGDDRVIIISDSLRACGMPDGSYELGGQTFHVNGPRATLDDGTLAGSVSDQMACLRTAVRTMGVPLTSAVKAASANPARALGVDADYGSLAPGHVASAVVLTHELEVAHVVLRGRLLH